MIICTSNIQNFQVFSPVKVIFTGISVLVAVGNPEGGDTIDCSSEAKA